MDTQSTLSNYFVFTKVAETGNISNAAKELFISQPAISKAIQKLEIDLNVTLFTRSSRGVRLTEEGKLLYSYTKEAFASLSQGEAALKQNREFGIGHIRIGASTTLCKYMLLPYLKEFVSLYPHIRFTILCQSSTQTMELIKNGKIDIGLIGRPDGQKSLTFQAVNEIEDIFVATDTYIENLKLREGGPLTGNQLFSAGNLMLLDEKNITRVHIDNYFASHQIQTGQLFEVGSMDLLIEFARTGLGIACVIREFVEEDLQKGFLSLLPLTFPVPKREVGFSWLKNRVLPDSVQKFIYFAYHTFEKTKIPTAPMARRNTAHGQNPAGASQRMPPPTTENC